MEELNKKIAEWLELKEFGIYADHAGNYYFMQFLELGQDLVHYYGQAFHLSFDVCFKYIVPKLFTWNVGKNWELQNDLTIKENGFKASVDKGYIDPDKYDQIKPFEAIAETPALAFCLAVEKLIDA